MALNRCEKTGCGTLFSIGAETCPACKGKRFHEEGTIPPAPKKPARKPKAGK